MPTILELFRGSTFDTDVDSKSQEGKGTLFSQVKSFGEQELTGVRVKSAVELNNPLIYGNEATRIALRSTPSMDKMRTDEGDGGLIGGAIKNLRTVVNSTIGVPQTLIPSSYTKSAGGGDDTLKGLAKLASDAASKASDKFGRGGTLNDPKLGIQSEYPKRLIEIKKGGQGSFIGGLLSGGTPKAIAQQAAGKLITEGKKKIREALFKNNPFKSKGQTGSTTPTGGDKNADDKKVESPKIYESTKGAKYSEQAKENKLFQGKTYLSIGDREARLRVAPSYVQVTGIDSEGKQIKIEPDIGTDGVQEKTGGELSFPASDDRFSNDNNELLGTDKTTKGFTNKDDVINQSGIYDGGTGAETNDQFNLGEKDFIPLYFRNIVTGETVHFRGTITGLSETVSPSWSSGKFSGNPFSYHTYESIERSVSFNFTIYPMNSAELANNWTKIEFLTSLTYPLGYQSGQIGSVRAPIIYFTMGDLYKDKVCFIDSLQYTIPDNSNWQLDGKTEQVKEYNSSGEYFSENGGIKEDVDKGYKLPHLVEVATTLKFIEQRNNTEDRTKLYSFKSLTYGN